MPSGVTHLRIAWLALIGIVVATAYGYDHLVAWFGRDSLFEYLLLFAISFLAGTCLLSPDLDVTGSDPARSWGVAGAIWRPYARLFRHRGVSHLPVIGTLTRVLYLGAVAYVVAATVESLMGWTWPLALSDARVLWGPKTACVLVGLVAADLLHVAADRVFGRKR